MADLDTELQVISLGRQGEHGVMTLTFDLSDYAASYGAGTATLIHRRNRDSLPYTVETTLSGNNILSWPISAYDTEQDGYGQAEIRWSVAGALKKSAIFITSVTQAMTTVYDDSLFTVRPHCDPSTTDETGIFTCEVPDGINLKWGYVNASNAVITFNSDGGAFVGIATDTLTVTGNASRRAYKYFCIAYDGSNLEISSAIEWVSAGGDTE